MANSKIRETQSKSQKKWFQKNKVSITEKRKSKRQELRFKLLSVLGNKCVQCGFSDYRALQIDHINGNGAQERKNHNGSLRSKYFLNEAELDFEKFLSRYQLLCANCNWIKRDTNNEVRKQKKC